jgi:hypothetical protein
VTEVGNDVTEVGNDVTEVGNDVTEVGNDIVSSSSGLTRGSRLIIKELIKKYTLLLKGAIKYDRIHDTKKYEKRLKELQNELN